MKNKKTIKDDTTGLHYVGRVIGNNVCYYIEQCWSISPNNEETQDIYVEAKTYDGEKITLVFNPDDYIDTFTPTMFDHVKKHYINYLKQKK